MSGMRDVIIIEAHLFVVLGGSNTLHFSSFCGACFKEGSLIEDSECGCLSHHATIVESLGPSLWVVMFGIIYFVEIYNPNFDNIFNDIF